MQTVNNSRRLAESSDPLKQRLDKISFGFDLFITETPDTVCVTHSIIKFKVISKKICPF